MRKGIVAAAQEVAQWCDAHPNSYPPTVLHVTDGEASDGDPESSSRTTVSYQPMMDKHYYSI